MINLNNGSIEIKNVTPVIQFGEIQYYTTTITVQELYDAYSRLTYDGEAQRGTVDSKPMIDRKHVNQIYESFVDGSSIRGHLTWNMRKDSEGNNFIYDSKFNSLTINKDQLITIPDSAHRHEALRMVAENVDDDTILESSFTLDIYDLSITEEKELFYTINGKIKSPNRNRTLYLSNDIKCRLLRDIIAQSNLDGKIECVRNSAYKDGKLTKFSTIYDSLFGSHGSFKHVNIDYENYDEYLNWLTDFYDELLNTRPEFNRISTSREKAYCKQESMALEEITWWGYGLLANKLKEDRKWKHNLHKKMNHEIKLEGGVPVHFMSKSLPHWHGSIIKTKFDPIDRQPIRGTSVTNSNTTREAMKKHFHWELF